MRYVITLDADTRLPRETVRRLIGKMAHPLNRPRFDAARGRVVEGYAILQPRVTPSLPVGREGSLFLRVFSSASGIDPYAAAVSDVYQDLFGEGSYTGKGIYDVDAFEAALAGRVPESRLLSHDLFEGIFARAGLASDVEVVEDFPARYDIAAARHHRWARGDWQLLPWMLALTPAFRQERPRGGVPIVGRWKMLDNLRRSLSAPSTVAALLAGWAAPADAALIWTLFLVATLAIPPLLPVTAELASRRPGVALSSHLRTVAGDLRLALVQIGLMLVFLAHQAWLMGDAMLRTLFRLTISHRRLLEWTPAAQAASGRKLTLTSFYGRMAGALAVAAAGAAAGWAGGGLGWPLSLAFAAIWTLSPAIALRVSVSAPVESERPLPAADATALRLTARRTWRFFETFVTADTHYLPPDNFQETPKPVVAHRTSPTNIGLYLLSVLSARDFGWIGEAEAVERLEATMATLDAVEKFRGHFSTGTTPATCGRSTPDTSRRWTAATWPATCSPWQAAAGPGPLSPAPDPERTGGVLDALGLARDAALALPEGRRRQAETRRRLAGELELLATSVGEGLAGRWDSLTVEIERVADVARHAAIEHDHGPGARSHALAGGRA